ncbi:hypothetical protein DPMN_143538 [Dreissena polymorpha]|uniref:Uncharacterized protein n=1 Tax=Dreissena polymorpha TaxID=45954 RepID=A0A9D4GD84_DREPO|nr:hypothetical protein DPMN_143538 [Dreissena polymorpha]
MLQVFPTQLEMYWYETQVILACIGTLSTSKNQGIYSQRARVSRPDSLYLNTVSSACCLFSKKQRTPLEISACTFMGYP